jgi:hypothetical protein
LLACGPVTADCPGKGCAVSKLVSGEFALAEVGIVNDAVAGQLSWIVASYGRDVCEDPRRVEALLRDLSGESRREVAVLSGAAREGIPAELMGAAATVPAAILADRLAEKLQDHLGLSESAAQWAVAAWGSALGLDGFVLEGPAAERQPRLQDAPSRAVLRPLLPQAPGSPTPARKPGIGARPRLLHTLTGHTDVVTGVAFSPAGTLLATASYDKTARLWDTATGQTTRTLTGHHRRKGFLHKVAFSPDGTLLATASADKTARLWDTATGQTTRILSGHTDWVRAVAFSLDGTLLATGSQDATLRLWDNATGQNIRTLAGHTSHVDKVVFSPDGTLLATASADKTARLWALG